MAEIIFRCNVTEAHRPTFNIQKDMTCMLDTGATDAVVTKAATSKLGDCEDLGYGKISSYFDEEVRLKIVRFPRLSIKQGSSELIIKDLVCYVHENANFSILLPFHPFWNKGITINTNTLSFKNGPVYTCTRRYDEKDNAIVDAVESEDEINEFETIQRK